MDMAEVTNLSGRFYDENRDKLSVVRRKYRDKVALSDEERQLWNQYCRLYRQDYPERNRQYKKPAKGEAGEKPKRLTARETVLMAASDAWQTKRTLPDTKEEIHADGFLDGVSWLLRSLMKPPIDETLRMIGTMHRGLGLGEVTEKEA